MGEAVNQLPFLNNLAVTYYNNNYNPSSITYVNALNAIQTILLAAANPENPASTQVLYDVASNINGLLNAEINLINHIVSAAYDPSTCPTSMLFVIKTQNPNSGRPDISLRATNILITGLTSYNNLNQ